MICKQCDFKTGHANWCTDILNNHLINLTSYQISFMIKLLKNYKNLRKSHFVTTSGGFKQEKITDELVLIDGLIEYLKDV